MFGKSKVRKKKLLLQLREAILQSALLNGTVAKFQQKFCLSNSRPDPIPFSRMTLLDFFDTLFGTTAAAPADHWIIQPVWNTSKPGESTVLVLHKVNVPRTYPPG